MPTVMHISDLHRAPDDPIDNDTLLMSILSDIDRFAMLNEYPEAIIVSGDLVYGVSNGVEHYESEMARQYQAAFDLIERLCDNILDGDRSKVIIVPGNHDICWNTSIKSMEVVPAGLYPQNIRKAISDKDGNYRWSWKDQKLYKISRLDEYKKRLHCYWNFFEKFYSKTRLLLPVDRERGYHLFSIVGGKVLIAAFESTHRNDHLRYESELSTGVVSRCAMEIRKLGVSPVLQMAVWHHSIHGPPNKEDYLNMEAIREMAGLGFQIGFHGHQHLAETTDLSVSINGSSVMCVVSAGSLCAGWNDLPRGTDRQYNILKIDSSMSGGSLYVREMAEGSQFTERRRGRFIDGKIPLSWSANIKPVKPYARQLNEATVIVEEALGRPRKNIDISDLLELSPTPHTYPRSVLLKAMQANEDHQAIVDYFDPAIGQKEAIAVAEAAYRLGNSKKLRAAIEDGQIPEAYRGDFETRYRILSSQKV